MNNKEFDKIMTEPYSKEGWVVMPTKPLPENEEIANFIKSLQKSWLENPGDPYCAKCWIKLELNENEDIWCPECGLVIQVGKE